MSKEHDENDLNNFDPSEPEASKQTKKKYSTPWNSKFSDNENLKKRQYSRSSRNQPIKEASKLSQILLLLITIIVLIPFILFAVIESQKNNQEITSRTTNEITMSRKEQIQKLRRGVMIDGKKTSPAQAEIISTNTQKNMAIIKLTIHEGWNHQVKKMFEAIGYHVQKLKRENLSFLDLGTMNPGDYRELTAFEVDKLKKEAKG